MREWKFIVLLALLIVQIAGSTVSAQRKADSLKRLLGTDLNDTSAARLYLHIYADYYQRDIFDSALLYAEKALACSQKSKNQDFIGKSHEAKATCYRYLGDFEKTHESLKLAAEGYKKGGSHESYAFTTFRLGVMQMDMGNYDAAITLEEEALKTFTALKQVKGQAECLNAIGRLHHWKGNYPLAFQFLYNALRKYEQIKDDNGKAGAFSHVAALHLIQGNHEQALKMFHAGLKIYEAEQNFQGMANIYNHIANCYLMQNRPEDALRYHSFSLRYKEQIQDFQGKAASHDNIGLAHFEIGQKAQEKGSGSEAALQYEKALKNFFEALKIQEPAGDQYGSSISYENIAAVYSAQKRYSEAQQYAERALAISEAIGDLEGIKAVEENLSQIYAATGDYGGALKHYKKHIRVRDSLQNEENTRKEVQLQMQYEFDKKEAEAKTEQEKKDALTAEELRQRKKQRNYFIAGFVLVFLLAGFILFNFLQKRKANVLLAEKNRLIAQQKHEVEEKQKEILDSIHYAKRIQRALITSEKNIERYLQKLKKPVA